MQGFEYGMGAGSIILSAPRGPPNAPGMALFGSHRVGLQPRFGDKVLRN